MSALDLILVAAVVAGAAAFLLWQIGGRKKKPACHPPQPEVVVGPALKGALDRRRKRI
jgi:hypothetical protein